MSRRTRKINYFKKLNKLPKILVAVHMAGQSCEMERIKALSEIYNFNIIEDFTCPRAKYKDNYVGIVNIVILQSLVFVQ